MGLSREKDYNLFQASSFATSTANGGVFHFTLEAGAYVCLVTRADVCGACLGNANVGGMHLQQIENPTNGVTPVPGMSMELDGRDSVSSLAKVRRNNTSELGTVTAITGTALGQFGRAMLPGTGSTAAGMTSALHINLAPIGGFILRPNRSVGFFGGQTGEYFVFSFEWFEIPEEDFDDKPIQWWRQWATGIGMNGSSRIH